MDILIHLARVLLQEPRSHLGTRSHFKDEEILSSKRRGLAQDLTAVLQKSWSVYFLVYYTALSQYPMVLHKRSWSNLKQAKLFKSLAHFC